MRLEITLEYALQLPFAVLLIFCTCVYLLPRSPYLSFHTGFTHTVNLSINAPGVYFLKGRVGGAFIGGGLFNFNIIITTSFGT